MYEFLWRCIFRHALVWENGEAMERKMHSYAAAAQLVCQQGSQSPQSLPSCPCINRQHMQQAASPQPAEDMKAVAGECSRGPPFSGATCESSMHFLRPSSETKVCRCLQASHTLLPCSTTIVRREP